MVRFLLIYVYIQRIVFSEIRVSFYITLVSMLLIWREIFVMWDLCLQERQLTVKEYANTYKSFQDNLIGNLISFTSSNGVVLLWKFHLTQQKKYEPRRPLFLCILGAYIIFRALQTPFTLKSLVMNSGNTKRDYQPHIYCNSTPYTSIIHSSHPQASINS